MSTTHPTYAARIAIAVLFLVGGAVVGVCAVALHNYWWGLLLGVAATVALLVAIPGGWSSGTSMRSCIGRTGGPVS